MYKPLHDKGVNVTVKDQAAGTWSTWDYDAGAVLAAGRVLVLHDRQMQMGGNKAMSFGKSRARLPPCSRRRSRSRRGRRG